MFENSLSMFATNEAVGKLSFWIELRNALVDLAFII
jgi:hypothetical protein